VQEFGRYFDMPTVCFRGGCLTGPNHAGAQLHGFLSYLMRCTVSGQPYTVFGYGAKQVRDNIHSADLVAAFQAFHRAPRAGAVYNMGGGRQSNCSMIEAIDLCERIAGTSLDWSVSDTARMGDHRWWVSDLDEFRNDYPEWTLKYDVESILREMHAQNVDAWSAERAAD
jgi:CDP-paratose 2-epimerase